MTPLAEMTPSSVLTDLQSIVGAEYAREPSGDHGFAVDRLRPQAVVEPGTYEEVAGVVRYANDSGLAVIPWGGGQLMHLANVPRRYDMALRLTRLDQIIEYEPADLTVTCQAGTTTDNLWKTLQAASQMTPFGPPWSTVTTVGGLLAANHSAHHREAYGTPRDFTIGMRVVTPDGRIARAGGKVVKNVAGYDVCKLWIGSRGTLGVIVEASFKLLPSPERWQTRAYEMPSFPTAAGAAAAVKARGLGASLVQVHNQPAIDESGAPRRTRRWELVISLPVRGSATDRIRADLTRIAEAAEGKLMPSWDPYEGNPWMDVASRLPRGWPLSCQISLLPTRVPNLVAALEIDEPLPQITASPNLGIVSPYWYGRGADLALLERVRALAANFDATLTVTNCSPELKRQIDVFGEVPPKTLDLMRRIKQQFDPNGILSPGRFVGRL